MIDREKVIKGLECCLPMTRRNGLGDCHNCPYDRKITLEGGVTECCHNLMTDVLALLKAQEPVEPTWRLGVPFCSKCGRQFKRGYKYCPDCGVAVKWE